MLIIILISVITGFFVYIIFKAAPKAPPEPFGLPIVGHLPFLGSNPIITYSKWSKKYGKIIQIRLGSTTGIIIDDPDLAKEAFNKLDLAGTNEMEFLKEFNGGKYGIIFNVAGATTLYNVALATFRVRQEIRYGKGLDTLMSRIMVMFSLRIAEMFPGISGWTLFKKAVEDLKDFFNHLGAEHKKDLIENKPRDFIDAYLDEINRTVNPNSSFYKLEGEKSLPAVIFDLFQGGFGTVSLTLNWAVLYISTHLEVQRKFQAEIDNVGTSKLPSLEDKALMPYSEALLMEIFRKSSVAVITPHRATVDVMFHGYKIKKGTMITVNPYSIHHNTEIWGDPENFRPERFLDAQGNCVKRHEALIPFSIGKRSCVGETLSRDEIFFFLVTIYRTKPDPNSTRPSLIPKFTGAMAPHEYQVVIEDRFRSK